jgi:glycosyltransferase involved in cell wall biosynthesis
VRVLHFFYNKAIPVGILNQLTYEVNSFKGVDENLEWHVKVIALEGDYSQYPFVSKVDQCYWHKSGSIALRQYAFRWLKDNVHRYDVVIFRYSLADPFLLLHHRMFKNIYTIHHTLEEQEISLYKGWVGAIKSIVEYLNGKVVLRRVKGVIGVTREIVAYEKQRKLGRPVQGFCWPNGIDMDEVSIANDGREGIPKFMMTSSKFSDSWNGLDLIVNYLKKFAVEFEFFIIGNVPDEHLSLIGDDPRFHVLGLVDSNVIRSIAEKCDFGFGSFALERKGMREACTLKVREYLALGIPVLSGHVDSGLPSEFPYYRKIDLSSCNIFEYVQSFRSISREAIRSGSEIHVSKSHLMGPIIDWLTEAESKRGLQ